MKNLTKQQRQWVISRYNKVQGGVFEAPSMLAYKAHCSTQNVPDDSSALKCWAYAYCGNKPYATLSDSQKTKVCSKLEQEINQWKS